MVEPAPLKMGEGSFIAMSSKPCSGLPLKRFQRHRQVTLPWFTGHIRITLHSFLEIARVAVVMTVAIAPFGIVNCLASPRIQAGGNLPYYDCIYSGRFTFQGLDLPFGRMTFAQAKAVDLVWDTIVGRTLQTLMLVVTYKVFMKVLMRITERYPVSYEVFAALSLSPTRISVLWPLSKALFSSLGNMARFSILWLLLSTVYLALFPSFIDAVSGYQAIRLTKLVLSNGSTADLSHGLFNIKEVDSDGLNNIITGSYISRILPRPRPSLESLNITWQDSQQSFTALSIGYYATDPNLIYTAETFFFADYAIFPDQSINLVYSVCENHTTAQIWWANITIDKYEEDAIIGNLTSLLSSVGPVYKYADTSCGDWFSLLTSRDRGLKTAVPTLDWPFFINESFLKDHENYECVSQDVYQWGFSYAWLLIVTSVSGVWIFGTWILWFDAELNSEIVNKRRKFGTWRAVLDLAESVNKDLGPDTCAYSEDELMHALKEKGHVGYSVGLRSDGVAHLGLSSGDVVRKRFKLDWDQEYGRGSLYQASENLL